jgi:pimeloyl-ACP methyl ester carboxylesterase
MNIAEKKRTRKKAYIDGPAGLLHIDDGGKGGIPVIFLHSFGGSIEQWRKQLEHLRENRRAIAIDLRGHGASSAPTGNNYQVESMAADIDAVVDQLKLRRFVLVAHSMGGSAAIAYAWMHPERVAGLLVTGTPGKTPEEQARQIIKSLESEAYEDVMEDFMQRLLVNASAETEQSEREGMKKLSREASVNFIKNIFKYDPIPAFRSFKGPKLIVETTATEKQPNALSAQMPGIPHKTVEGTSHWIQMDKPEEFNRLLDDFLGTITTHPASTG